MTHLLTSRRGMLGSGAALLFAASVPALAQSRPAIHIVKDPDCGCCTAWARFLYADGFDVTFEHRSGRALDGFKLASGIPPALFSCHTAMVEGYAIEGHVPLADIRRLLAERPQAVGLAVPGMPYGSLGMGPDSERDAYSVFLIGPDGNYQVFSDYPAA